MTVDVVRSEEVPLTTAWRATLAYLATAGVVLLLMMVFGLAMRMAQAGWLPIEPDVFYQLMTVHGVGMVGLAGIGGAAIMWHFVGRYVPLNTGIFVANLALFVLGAALILGAGFIGGFASGWTFLFPLPSLSGGAWSNHAAAAFLVGLVLIGVGFLLMYLDVARGVMSVYGSLGAALGVRQVFGGADEHDGPPPAVVATTMVLIVNTLGLILGAAVLVMSIINLYRPEFTIDALAAKNMTYFFGHVFINATIYMAIVAVYEILPIYTRRPWKGNKVFYSAWMASTIMVLLAYTHHLLMDFAMPTWALVMGQIVSYLSGLPVLVVTAYGALMIVYRSGLRWDVASGLLFTGVLGWAAGVLPAIVDATIVVNSVMHNTLWVPGHFHTYLLLGMIAMLLGFMTFVTKDSVGARATAGEIVSFWLYLLGGVVLVVSFLAAGSIGVPRRFAVHLPEWISYDQFGSVGAAAVVIATAILVGQFLVRLPVAARTVGGPDV